MNEVTPADGTGIPARARGQGVRACVAVAVALAVWLPCLHLFFAVDPLRFRAERGVAPEARAMLRRQLALWETPDARARELARMRRSNAEWDFMGRTFLVLALANASLREPGERDRYLAIMDALISETIRLERENGIYYFLMDYAQAGSFLGPTRRSLFQDGEIAMMLAARRLVREKPEYKAPLAERAAWMLQQMEAGPVLCGESYPDECWMFCNAVALAAFRMCDALDGSDHRPFARRWVETAKRKLVDPATGLLVSNFSLAGEVGDGPEGSSIWMVAHCLQIVDRPFAGDQYRRARKELARNALGFGYAREWPEWRVGMPDVDSGPVVPGLQASAGSSGMALLAAAAFDDRAYLASLLTSLEFGAFPERRNGQLRYLASNQVGDAAMLYALVLGPLWKEVERRAAAAPAAPAPAARRTP